VSGIVDVFLLCLMEAERGFRDPRCALTGVVKEGEDDYRSYARCNQQSCQEEREPEQRPLEKVQLPTRDGHERHLRVHAQDKGDAEVTP